MKTQIVLGTFFGDEGKGSTVQWLCKQAIDRGEKPIVVRFSGGQQAGHRIIANGIEHVCSSFGSGVLLGVPTYLDRNVIIDPICMYEEYQQLVAKGVTPVIYINDNCRITTPYDVNANVNDSKVLGHGSCGMGIYHTFKRCEFMKQSEYWMYSLYGCGITSPSKCLGIARNYYKTEALPELDKRFVEACEWLRKTAKYEPIISGAAFRHYHVNAENVTYIFEGSQGLLLDMECGFMPHCTPTKVGLNGVSKTFLKEAEVFLVMRTYLTRHGNGYIPSRADMVREYFEIDEPTNRDDGFQGVFKHGLFEETMLRRVFDRHHIDNWKNQYALTINGVVTHLDCQIEGCIPFFDKQMEYVRYSEESFLRELSTYFDNVYGSYSPELSAEQFKLFTSNY